MLGITKKRARAPVGFVSSPSSILPGDTVELVNSPPQLVRSLRQHLRLFPPSLHTISHMFDFHSNFLTKVYSCVSYLVSSSLQRFDDCSVLPKVRATVTIHLPASSNFVPYPDSLSVLTCQATHGYPQSEHAISAQPSDLVPNTFVCCVLTHLISHSQGCPYRLVVYPPVHMYPQF
jgi:hypothetical protein